MFFALFLRFGINDIAGSRVDVHFRHLPVTSDDFDFPDRLAVSLFQFGFDHRSLHLLRGGFDGLVNGDLCFLYHVGGFAFTLPFIIAPRRPTRQETEDGPNHDRTDHPGYFHVLSPFA